MTTTQLRAPPTELSQILAVEEKLVLSHFTSDDAFSIGCAIRERIRSVFPGKAAVINIVLTNSDNLLFHAVTSPGGIAPDNDLWVARKRKTVKRWGMSTWAMRHKMISSEEVFKAKFMLGDAAAEYAIHGGGVPVRVEGVEGVVAVIVVSGLKQEDDHQVIVEALENVVNAPPADRGVQPDTF